MTPKQVVATAIMESLIRQGEQSHVASMVAMKIAPAVMRALDDEGYRMLKVGGGL